MRYNFLDRPIPFEERLTILVSNFYLLRDERKGRESVRVKGRKKRGREYSDPNGIGLYQIDICFRLSLLGQFYEKFYASKVQ